MTDKKLTKAAEMIKKDVDKVLDLLDNTVKNHGSTHNVKMVPISLVSSYVKIIKDSYAEGIGSGEVVETRKQRVTIKSDLTEPRNT